MLMKGMLCGKLFSVSFFRKTNQKTFGWKSGLMHMLLGFVMWNFLLALTFIRKKHSLSLKFCN